MFFTNTITHPLNPERLKAYDKIIYMENGMISETRTYDELKNKCDLLYALATE